MKPISLYIHIPFCKQKCKYCAFVSFVGKEAYYEGYINKVIEELDFHKKIIGNKEIATIYIGGGTPSVLDKHQLPKLLDHIKQNFTLKLGAEITVEANPESFTFDKAVLWKNAGVNRLSFGLQSIDDEVLKKLGRVHTYNDYLIAIENAKKAGFTNINTDILLGLQGQMVQFVLDEITKISNLGVVHISAYGLQIEDNTKLKQEVESGNYVPADEELSVLIYNSAVKKLKELGFNRYEISNFAKQGFESKHNLNYWARGEFIGVGVGAFGFIDGMHYQNTSDLHNYLKVCYKLENIEKETQKTAMEEKIMLALRTERGLDINEFNRLFGFNFLEKFSKQIEKLKANNLISQEGDFIKINNFEVSNQIISEFF